MSAKMSDEALYQAYLAGDELGLRTLMERYGDPITYYVHGYIHDVHYAEDLMIEAFSRVIAKRPRLREGGFRPYLYKTARNLALRHVERDARVFSLDDIAHDLQDEARTESVIVKNEARSALYRCLGKLPKDYREALYLVYFENMSYAEAAKVMGKTRKQVDNLVSRGKSSMRMLLEQEGVTDAFD